MAIRIPTLEIVSKQFQEKKYVYKDLHLDLSKETVYNKQIHAKREREDISVDLDTKAIKNSIINLFGTRPGQRFLFPKYGLNLNKYLFEAITDEHARFIGEEIVRAITQFEARVIVINCKVLPHPDDNLYDITLSLQVPAFNASTTINSYLNTKTETFTFL